MFTSSYATEQVRRSAKNAELYRIVQAYYIDKLTQQQIAQRFGLLQDLSSLAESQGDAGVITITRSSPSGGLSTLEQELERRYNLQEAIVVSVSDPRDLGGVKRELGPAAAEWLVRSVHGDEIVALV